MLSAEANFRQLKPCLIAFNKEDMEEELLTGLHLQTDATHQYLRIYALLQRDLVCLNAMLVLLNSSFRFDIGFSLVNFEV